MSNRSRARITKKMQTLFERGFVLVDLETTGLPNYTKVEIIEIGAINQAGEVVLHQLVKPRWPIPATASLVNGLYDEDVADAPRFDAVYPAIAEALNGQHVIAYNVAFEQRIFNLACERDGLAPLQPQAWDCALKTYKGFNKALRSYSLVNACRYEGVEIIDAHRALGDCQMTLALLKKIAEANV